MRESRTLTLKRDRLAELDPNGLRAVVGAGLTDTCYSCLDYVSCRIDECYGQTLICA